VTTNRCSLSWLRRSLVAAAVVTAACATAAPLQQRAEPQAPADPRCVAANFERTEGIKVWSRDGSRYILNKKDERGFYQLYVAARPDAAPQCITCTRRPDGPLVDRHKLQPHWMPNGQWIVVAGEWEKDHKPFWASSSVVEGWVASGLSVDMYLVRPDGSEWRRITNYENERGDGYTGPAITPDGRRAVWAQIVDGNFLRYTFGKWELILADVREENGAPVFVNRRNITPPDMNWVEVGNFAPDNHTVILSGDYGLRNAQGMDQFLLDIDTGRIRNIVNEPVWWDEHGMLSPDGRKVLFMSSRPFNSAQRSTVLFLATEFMVMNSDGSGVQQLTHFNTPGYPESNSRGRISVAANGEWHPDGRSVTVLNLFFPNYEAWTITFTGNCGAEAR
jgi:Tol biopolymer transport system component